MDYNLQLLYSILCAYVLGICKLCRINHHHTLASRGNRCTNEREGKTIMFMKLLIHTYSLNIFNAQTYKIKHRRVYVMVAWYKDNKYNVSSWSEKKKYMYVKWK